MALLGGGDLTHTWPAIASLVIFVLA